MTLSESFQVAAIFEKLPPAWKDFKNYLKHKRKEMNVEELIVGLRIEEDNKSSERRLFSPTAAKANVVEHGQSSKKSTFSSSKRLNLGPKGGISKKKFSGKCYNCDGMGHKASECKKPKRNREANVVESISQEVSNMNLFGVISEVNLVGSNPREWWIDIGVTRHVCSDKEMFATLDESMNGEKLFMGNSATSEIKGQGKVVLEMTSGKELTLNNKVVLSKSGMFVGKGYVCNGLFKLNVMAIKSSEVENQLSKKFKVLRSDRGGEYESPFSEFSAQHGIKHERTAPYSPQQNGIAEKKNRILKEMMNALLLSSGLPQNMWGKLF
ncbi:uncharacterized protein [Primulina huaijiensis]|uniref:uncharacterized protein n=1 Tax=Primulina huaijiensis TaxID=1492673 RepID=UPI003CC6F07D